MKRFPAVRRRNMIKLTRIQYFVLQILKTELKNKEKENILIHEEHAYPIHISSKLLLSHVDA